MKTERQEVKIWLKKAIKTPFYKALDEARLTPREQNIALLRFDKGRYNYQVAMDLDISESTVRDEMAIIYDKVKTVLDSRIC